MEDNMRKILIVAIMLFAVMIPVFAEGQIGVTLAPEWFWITSVEGEKIPESFGESSFMLGVDGANYFGENGGFGVEYGIGLGLPMRIWEGQLSAKSPEKAGFAFNVGAGYRYEFSDLIGIVAGLGLGGYYQNSAAIFVGEGNQFELSLYGRVAVDFTFIDCLRVNAGVKLGGPVYTVVSAEGQSADISIGGVYFTPFASVSYVY